VIPLTKTTTSSSAPVSHLPQHIAIIMDGNGRWAKKRGLPRLLGHRFGMRRVKEIVKTCGKLGVKFLTLYAFSRENWSRPAIEVRALMSLLHEYVKKEIDELNHNKVRLETIGRIAELPSAAKKALREGIRKTKNNQGLTLILALNYSGRSEIVDGIKKLCRQNAERGKNLKINEESFSQFLYTRRFPDPDLLIRTSGEMRLSNFLLWQMAYAEIWVTPVLWPDFGTACLMQALGDYQKRERRFGGIGAQ
jgi:undecaprenyl diphosphate synthase